MTSIAKKIGLLGLMSIAALTLHSQCNINGGFEVLDTVIILGEERVIAEGWRNENGYALAGCETDPVYSQLTTDANMGQYAMYMESMRCYGFGSWSNPGIVRTGDRSQSAPYSFAKHCSLRPDSLRFSYKLSFGNSTDSAVVLLMLFNYDSLSTDLLPHERIDTIAYSKTFISEATSIYQSYAFPLVYASAESPTLLKLGFYSSACVDPNEAPCHLGTKLWIDDIEFVGGTVGLSDNRPLTFSMSPNPARNELNLSLSAGLRAEQIVFRDIAGRELAQQLYASTIDVSFLPSGMYFVQVYHTEGVLTRRLLID